MKKIILILFSISLLSCKDKKENMFYKKIIDIDFEKYFSRDLRQFIDTSLNLEVNYIPLQTIETSLIGNIEKILFVRGKYFIQDFTKTKSIFVFNNEGDFLYKINKNGKGPGEYLSPLSFDVDSLGNVYIYDSYSSKLINYFDDGKRFEEFKIRKGLEEFGIIGNHKIFIRCMMEPNTKQKKIGIYDLKSNKFQEIDYLKDTLDYHKAVNFNFFSFFRSNDTIYYWPRFTNKIFKISSSGVKEFISFSERLIPPQDIIANLEPKNLMNLTDKEYLFDIQQIYETSETITLSFRNSLFPLTLFISKESSMQNLFLSYMDNKYLGDYSVVGVVEDSFISLIPSNKYSKPDWESRIRNSKLDEVLVSKLLSLDKNSNPTIILLKPKKF